MKFASAKQVIALVKEANSTKAKVSEITGRLGERVKNAVDGGNLHAKAFSLTAWADRQDELKRKEFFYHLDAYRDIMVKEGAWSEDHVGDLIGNDALATNGPAPDMPDADAVETAAGAGAGDDDADVSYADAPEKKARRPRATKVEMERRRVVAAQSGRPVTAGAAEPTPTVEPATAPVATEEKEVVSFQSAREMFHKRRKGDDVDLLPNDVDGGAQVVA